MSMLIFISCTTIISHFSDLTFRILEPSSLPQAGLCVFQLGIMRTCRRVIGTRICGWVSGGPRTESFPIMGVGNQMPPELDSPTKSRASGSAAHSPLPAARPSRWVDRQICTLPKTVKGQTAERHGMVSGQRGEPCLEKTTSFSVGATSGT